MNNNKKHLKISQLHLLIIGFMLLLSACSPASETQEPTPPAPAASQTAALPTATDTPQNTQALPTEVPATPTLTATATPSPTPTPPPVYQSIDEQYITIGFPEYRIDSDTKDGVTVWLYKEITGLDDTSLTWFQFPTTYYSIFINPDVAGVYSLQVDFTIYTEMDTKGGTYVFAGLFPPDASFDTFQNIFQPDWSEDVVGNNSYTERIVNPDSSRTYHIEIPYSAFQSGKYQFSLRILNDVQASDPEFSILVQEGTNLADVFVDASYYKPSTAPVLSSTDEFGEVLIPNTAEYVNFTSYNGSPSIDIFPLVRDAHTSIIANYTDGAFVFWHGRNLGFNNPDVVEYLEENQITIDDNDVFILPEELAEAAILSFNDYYTQPQTFAYLQFAYERMLDEETNLLRGVYYIVPDFETFDPNDSRNPFLFDIYPEWNTPQGELLFTERRNYAAIDFLELFAWLEFDMIDQDAGVQVGSYYDAALYYSEEYQRPARQLFEHLALGVADNEIVEVNGQFYYAPEGVEMLDDGTASFVINPDVMGNALGILNAYNYLKFNLEDDVRSHRLLLGYAYTLSLMLEMQDQTPTNLFPEFIQVKISPDGTKNFTPSGEFNIANDFIINFPRDLFMAETLFMGMQRDNLEEKHLVQYMDGNTPEEKWENFVYVVEEQWAAFELVGGGYQAIMNVYDYWKTYGLAGNVDVITGEITNDHLSPAQAAAWFRVGYIAFDQQLRGEALKAMNDAMVEVADYYALHYNGEQDSIHAFNDTFCISLPDDAPAFFKNYREEIFDIEDVMQRFDGNYENIEMRRVMLPFGLGLRLSNLNSFLYTRWSQNRTFLTNTPMPEYLLEYMESIGLE